MQSDVCIIYTCNSFSATGPSQECAVSQAVCDHTPSQAVCGHAPFQAVCGHTPFLSYLCGDYWAALNWCTLVVALQTCMHFTCFTFSLPLSLSPSLPLSLLPLISPSLPPSLPPSPSSLSSLPLLPGGSIPSCLVTLQRVFSCTRTSAMGPTS